MKTINILLVSKYGGKIESVWHQRFNQQLDFKFTEKKTTVIIDGKECEVLYETSGEAKGANAGEVFAYGVDVTPLNGEYTRYKFYTDVPYLPRVTDTGRR